MKEITLLSWNVNGIRATQKKGFMEWFQQASPDVLCVQETKAQPEQLDKMLAHPTGYFSYWHSAERKGYSGVVTFTKEEPTNVDTSIGIEKFDIEGRMIATEFPEFILFNVYFPNGKKNQERLLFKLDFYDEFFKRIEDLRAKGKSIIFCGDINTAHKPIDLARPKANETISGFLPIERKWIDKVIEHGYIDTFRHFHKEPDQYSWWSQRTKARERNVGWRIDYFFISEDLLDPLKDAFILSDIMGSDHCPIGIKLKF
ncbi:MAG: exodeoxyribonuclease III [Promethearchaeota archaeon]